MQRKRTWLWLAAAAGLFVGLTGLWWSQKGFMIPGSSAKSGQVTVYDPDPEHLWNRLHEALFLRTGENGQAYGLYGLDPLVSPESKHLLQGERHRQIIALLDRFLNKKGEKLVNDPLKRAFFQRDLWAIFDQWAKEDRIQPQWQALQKRLAKVMRRVALSADQIKALPDNYADAVAAKDFPTKHDPSKPETTYLPPSLTKEWVLLGNPSKEFIAPEHTHHFGGRSAFLVYMLVPEGRQATLDYLDRLMKFPKPRSSGRWNPELPQFSPGTQVALVRRMMLIDDQGKVTPTGITESVQIRVIRDIPKREVADFSKQDVYELKLGRQALFAGKAGGLQAVGSEDETTDVFYLSNLIQNGDPFVPREKERKRESAVPHTCMMCHGGACGHSGPGIQSVLSYSHAADAELPDHFFGSKDKDGKAFNSLDQMKTTATWKSKEYSLSLLQRFTKE